MRIELTLLAWEASILPLNYIRIALLDGRTAPIILDLQSNTRLMSVTPFIDKGPFRIESL